MESCTYQTAAQIDVGESDFMLETAMLKVYSTDVLWQIINDTIQIFGGKAYFTDEPFERMMRDARINMIGEGANDVLCVFSSLMGMCDVGLELAEQLEGEGIVEVVDDLIVHFDHHGIARGNRIGGAGLRIDDGHLAEDLAGLHGG